jgi:hypothetical protein
MSNLSAISWREQVTFRRDNDYDKVRFALDQHTELDFYSPSLLKQRVYMSLHPDILYWFRDNSSLLLLIIDVSWEE